MRYMSLRNVAVVRTQQDIEGELLLDVVAIKATILLVGVPHQFSLSWAKDADDPSASWGRFGSVVPEELESFALGISWGGPQEAYNSMCSMHMWPNNGLVSWGDRATG